MEFLLSIAQILFPVIILTNSVRNFRLGITKNETCTSYYLQYLTSVLYNDNSQDRFLHIFNARIIVTIPVLTHIIDSNFVTSKTFSPLNTHALKIRTDNFTGMST